jgi:hypothetical protein
VDLRSRLPVTELAAGLREEANRPSKDLDAALGASILTQFHDRTDQPSADAVGRTNPTSANQSRIPTINKSAWRVFRPANFLSCLDRSPRSTVSTARNR